MTQWLDANFISWSKEDQFKTSFSGSLGNRLFTHNNVFGGQAGINDVRNMTQMPTAGRIVGLIVHVRNSNSDGQAEFVPVIGTSTENPFVQTSINNINELAVFIEAGETGFFFSDPDVPEFTREFNKDDWVGFRRRKNFGSDFPGISQVSVAFALELLPT